MVPVVKKKQKGSFHVVYCSNVWHVGAALSRSREPGQQWEFYGLSSLVSSPPICILVGGVLGVTQKAVPILSHRYL